MDNSLDEQTQPRIHLLLEPLDQHGHLLLSNSNRNLSYSSEERRSSYLTLHRQSGV